MKSTRASILTACLLVLGGPAWAETPLSAIDWLSDSVRTPTASDEVEKDDISTDASPGDVSVSPIGGPLADATGLLPVTVTGFPPDLWRYSAAQDIADRLRTDRSDIYPAMQALLYQLLLAELDPPSNSANEPVFLLARIDTLLALGAVEQASALIERAGASTPEVFRRNFDVSLLLRDETRTCEQMRDTPAISPTFSARIYCLARTGDWAGAALTLETGRALGFVSNDENTLLSHFLDLGLESDLLPLPLPTRPSPLEFRMYEAIGRPLPTTALPRAFAHTDLHPLSGWKTQIEAAERLTRSGAIDPNRLMGLYTQHKPAASGSVWDRAAAIQALDGTLLAGNSDALTLALGQAWRAMVSAELEVPFARTYCAALRNRFLPEAGARLRLHACLLAGIEVNGLALPSRLDDTDRLLLEIATGRIENTVRADPMHAALARAFSGAGIPVRLRSLVETGRTGEAILRAIDLFLNGANGELDELEDAILFFRSIGLERAARQGAYELLLLERHG